MASLSAAGAADYIDLTLRALDARLIPPSEAVSRMRVLRALYRGIDPPEWDRLTVAPHDAREGDPGHCSCLATAPDVSASGSAPAHLLLPWKAKLANWRSHKGDPDPLPSVPHAHHLKNASKKLDLYRGYIFLASSCVDRVGRQEIIVLWNDVKFRQFAREALNHFISTNPGYHFRVSRPGRLPRKRRA